MPYTLSGRNLTLTGTETLAGLNAVDFSGLGVSPLMVNTWDNYTQYIFDNILLLIDGNLTLSNHETLVMINNADNAIRVRDGGTLSIGSYETFTEFLTGDSKTVALGAGATVNIAGPADAPWNANDAGLRIFSGGRLDIVGGVLLTNKAFRADANSILRFKNARMVTDSSLGYQNVYFSTTDAEIDGLEIIDKGPYKTTIGWRAVPSLLKGYKPLALQAAISAIDVIPSGFGTIVFDGYGGANANRSDIAMRIGQPTDEYQFIDAVDGHDLVVVGQGGGNSEGRVTQYRRFAPKFADAITAEAVPAKLYLQDTDNGNRLAPYSPEGQTYTGLADLNGALDSQNLLTGIWHNGGATTNTSYTLDDRLPLVGGVAHYLYNHASITISESAGGTITDTVLLVPDTQITQRETTIVANYSETETAAKTYDFLKHKWVDSFANDPVWLSRVGDTIDAGENDVLIDPNAVETGFDNGIITIKATIFSGDITTTGNVSFLNGGTVTGLVSASNIDAALRFEGVSAWQLYASAADRTARNNPIAQGDANDTHLFKYVTNQTLHLVVTSGGTVFEQDVQPTAPGQIEVSVSTEAQLVGLTSLLTQTRDHALAADIQTQRS